MKFISQIISVYLLILIILTGVVIGEQIEVNNSQPLIIGKKIMFKSKILNNDIPVRVYLPPDYDSTNISYPVIYHIDYAPRFNQLVATIEYLIMMGEMPSSIIVSIPQLQDLVRDLNDTSQDQLNALIESRGIVLSSTQFFKNELIPFVEKQFRTSPYRTAIGHSMNGWYITLRLLVAPELFDSYIVSSMYPLWKDSTLIRLSRMISLDSEQSRPKKVYFSTGEQEREIANELPIFISLLDSLLQENIQIKYDVIPNENHSSVYFHAYLHGLRYINQIYPLPDDITNWSWDDLNTHYEVYSNSVGYKYEIPEQAILTLGYNLLQNEEYDKAIEVFQKNLKLYPNSWNAFDSMGDAFRLAGNIEEAIKYYRKSIEMNPDNVNGQRQLREIYKIQDSAK